MKRKIDLFKIVKMDEEMADVLDILVLALCNYYDKAQEEGRAAGKEEISFSKEDFVNGILSDFASFLICDFVDALEEVEEKVSADGKEEVKEDEEK